MKKLLIILAAAVVIFVVAIIVVIVLIGKNVEMTKDGFYSNKTIGSMFAPAMKIAANIPAKMNDNLTLVDLKAGTEADGSQLVYVFEIANDEGDSYANALKSGANDENLAKAICENEANVSLKDKVKEVVYSYNNEEGNVKDVIVTLKDCK
jgi:hypothetical protein